MNPMTLRRAARRLAYPLTAVALLLTVGCASQGPTAPNVPDGRVLGPRAAEPAPVRFVAEPVRRTLDQIRAATIVPTPTRPSKSDGRTDSWLSEAEIDQLTRKANRLPVDANIQSAQRGGVDFTRGTHFESIDLTECCGVGTIVAARIWSRVRRTGSAT
ncbi:MAG: hypothetical protein AAFY88_31745, partial [Acidobacteriota bacterium]